ncbi:uncharacterized protein OCT59_023499 [Rhizophagus irregularis]|uniref:uncharacterized protein n=1 Tax=Rhizophagus irregularis TaxID=588596 RepID=UPI0033295932|nr:hypothetical protein OCT59_023499 [Rhizophagus irregularis]
MDISNQNLDTTEITVRNNSKTNAKNLWKEDDDNEYQIHATIFSTESDETFSFFKKVNIMDLEKRKEVYGVCGECNEPGNIWYWDIENQKWDRNPRKVALKSLNNSSNISNDFLNEINYYISGHIHASNTVMCFGITQDPNTKDYMMVLQYFEGGNLRNILVEDSKLETKIKYLFCIIDGLSGIHDAGNIHKDFHSGNILYNNHNDLLSISDLGMCQPVNDNERKGIYGVIPYMAPEVLRGYKYTKAADIYSFGIIMNELMSEEIPYNDIPHDHFLGVKICKGFRPKISEDTPKLIVDLIIKCWDAKAENRPTAKELCQTFLRYGNDMDDENSEISYQIKECEKIKVNKLKNRTNENKSKNLQIHPQAIYTSRLLKFENLPEPVNSTNYLSSFQEPISSSSANLISECLDYESNELDLNQDDDE